MVATVRLDNNLETSLNKLSKMLNMKKSDIIREAIDMYAKNYEKSQKSRIVKAIEKTKQADKNDFLDFEDTLNDGF